MDILGLEIEIFTVDKTLGVNFKVLFSFFDES